MNLIKDGKIVPTVWNFIETGSQLITESNPIVSTDLLMKTNPDELGDLNIGVAIETDDQLDDILPFLSKIDLVVIQFSSFSDGRGFSIAYRLRNSIGYGAEIWVSGKLIADQYAQALQCGVDAVLIDDLQLKRQPIEQWQTALEDAPLPYRFENQMGRTYHESKKNSAQLINANDNGADEIDQLNAYFSNKSTVDLLKFVLGGKKFVRVALVSSFGIQSSVLLHLVAQIDRQTRVLSIDTGKLFPETLKFQKQLQAELYLENVKLVKQDPVVLHKRDPEGDLWSSDDNACCDLRKIEPLSVELARFDCWISGRKKFQGGMRGSLKLFERSGTHIKINPLANWTQEQIENYIIRHDLPAHPLAKEGYSSVGCLPCTTSVEESQSSRAGRWAGTEKTECGIHLSGEISAEYNLDTLEQTG